MPTITGGDFERARPIFPGTRRFHPIVSLAAITPGERQLELVLDTEDGPPVHGRVTFADERTVRIQWAFGSPPGPRRTEMLDGDPPELELTVEESSERVVVHAGGPPLILERRPWQVRFGGYRTEPADALFFEWVQRPGGWAVHDDRIQAYETLGLHAGERLYGTGERFLGPGVRGRRLTHWICEPYGTNTTDRVHKSVPFFLSTRGYGVFFNHTEEAIFDLGALSSASATVLVDAPELDLFVMLGDTDGGHDPKAILRRYTALTGRATVPPDWSFGVWMSRCMYPDRATVAEVIATARRLGIPCDVVNLDPLWLAHPQARSDLSCDFVWDSSAFGPLDDFIDWIHGEDVRLCLWVNPHVSDGMDAFVASNLVEGGRVRDPAFPTRGFVDLTGAGADWWRAEIRRLTEAGVDAFKLDFAEALPANAAMADGRTGAEVHNVYPLLASIAAADAGIPLAFTRAGTAGSQRFPLHWAGDSQSTWAGMAGALRGGLAAAWSGFAHWTSDIGGFYATDPHAPGEPGERIRQPDPELFVRWMQFGMLCSHTRFHGVGPREPWAFGDEAVDVARRFGELRTRLRPYLIECAREASETGCPVMRPLALEFPEDAGVRDVDTQFMLGPALLVCPVLEPGGSVEISIPPGAWTDHFTSQRFEGPGTARLQVPLDRLPLLVRDGYDVGL